MPAYGSQCLPLSTGFWYFLIFFLICLASFLCSAGFHALGLWVSRWLLRGVVMTHSTGQQLFIPPGLQIIHIYASGSRLFSPVSAILQVDQSHLLHRAFPQAAEQRIFCLEAPAWELLEKGAKPAAQRQKVLIWQAGKHKMGKSSWGLHRPRWCHQQGPPEVSSKWKEPH